MSDKKQAITSHPKVYSNELNSDRLAATINCIPQLTISLSDDL